LKTIEVLKDYIIRNRDFFEDVLKDERNRCSLFMTGYAKGRVASYNAILEILSESSKKNSKKEHG